MQENIKEENKNLKKAVVEQIILWIVIFTAFVGFLFFIIEYSGAVRVKENGDAIASYTAKMVSLSQDESDIIRGINNIKADYVNTLTSNSLFCSEDQNSSNRQVIVNVYATLDNSFLPSKTNNIHSKIVVFNESSEFKKECNITLSLK